MPGDPARSGTRLLLACWTLALAVAPGCSERAGSKERVAAQAAEFRKISFAGEWVVVSCRSGSTTAKIPGTTPGFVPEPGDRVVLSDSGAGDVFLGADLDALQFYHSAPGRDQLGRFRTLAETGKLFVVVKGTMAVVSKVVDGQLPDGLKAIELRLLGENGGVAWVSETFVRQSADGKKGP